MLKRWYKELMLWFSGHNRPIEPDDDPMYKVIRIAAANRNIR